MSARGSKPSTAISLEERFGTADPNDAYPLLAPRASTP